MSVEVKYSAFYINMTYKKGHSGAWCALLKPLLF